MSKHKLLDDEKKALIRQTFGINVDSDLFDPRYDYVAKRILTAESPESKQALISLLNAALKLVNKESVIDLTVINPELPVDNNKFKKSRFDIRVRFQNGEQGIIEIEWGKKDNFKKRSQFIISKAYSSQDISNKTYEDLKRCYLICIIDHPLFKEDDEYFRDGMFRDSKGNPITDDQIIIFLELSKIEKLLSKPVEELTDIECWLLFFRYITDKSKRVYLNKVLEKEEGVNMAAQILQTISKEERERLEYESQLIDELDRRSAERSAERKMQFSIAKNLKLINLPYEVIAKTTGISVDELMAL
jgi:predicted transposase/invertase (TIGR01784 family)